MDRRRVSFRAVADARRVRRRRRRAGHLPARVPLLAHLHAGKRLPPLAVHDLPQRVSAVARARRVRRWSSTRPKSTRVSPARSTRRAAHEGFDDVFARLDLAPAIARALAKVPEPFRSTLMIVDVEDQSYESAAETLGVPIGTVRSRLFRGRRLMQEQLLTLRERRRLRRASRRCSRPSCIGALATATDATGYDCPASRPSAAPPESSRRSASASSR